MSRTEKDVSYPRKRVLEVVKRDDGTFDLIFNRTLECTRILEQWLPKELCVRYGFCGEEYKAILAEINVSGRTSRVF